MYSRQYAAVCASILMFAFKCSVSRSQTASIIDQAVSSADMRFTLIRQYEDSTNSPQGERLLATAVSYAVEVHYDKAKQLYIRFLREQPDNVRALRGIGNVFMLENHYSDAIQYLRRAWSTGDVDSLQPLAASYWNIHDYARLGELVPDLLKHEKDNIDIADCLLAYALSKDPMDDELFNRTLNGLPNVAMMNRDDTALLLVVAANRLTTPELNNRTLQAILARIIQEYLRDTNAFPQAKIAAVGDAYRIQGRYKEAAEIYTRMLKDNPTNWIALRGLGIVDMYQGRPRDAIGKLRRAFLRGDEDSLRNFGTACVLAGDFGAMKEFIPAFLEHKDDNPEILNSLIACCLKSIPPDKELFYKAIQGVTDDRILHRQDTTDAVVYGLKLFGDTERANSLLKMKAQQDKGAKA